MDSGPLRTLLAGAGAGAAATVPMSAVLFAAQRAGFIGKLPPEKITEAALDAHRPPTAGADLGALLSVANRSHRR